MILYPGQYGFREQGQEMLKPGPNNHQGYGRNLQNVTKNKDTTCILALKRSAVILHLRNLSLLRMLRN